MLKSLLLITLTALCQYSQVLLAVKVIVKKGCIAITPPRVGSDAPDVLLTVITVCEECPADVPGLGEALFQSGFTADRKVEKQVAPFQQTLYWPALWDTIVLNNDGCLYGAKNEPVIYSKPESNAPETPQCIRNRAQRGTASIPNPYHVGCPPKKAELEPSDVDEVAALDPADLNWDRNFPDTESG